MKNKTGAGSDHLKGKTIVTKGNMVDLGIKVRLNLINVPTAPFYFPGNPLQPSKATKH